MCIRDLDSFKYILFLTNFVWVTHFLYSFFVMDTYLCMLYDIYKIMLKSNTFMQRSIFLNLVLSVRFVNILNHISKCCQINIIYVPTVVDKGQGSSVYIFIS